MAADPNHSVFFPATWLSLLRPFSAAVRTGFACWAVGFPLLVFAGLRGLRLSPFAAATASAAAAVCGPAMTLACFPSSGWAVALFFPLLALLARGSRGDRLAAGIVLGLAILAGEPALALEVLFLGSIFAISWKGGKDLRGSVTSIGAVALVGALVAAPQIVGAAQLLGQTVRASGLPSASATAFDSVRPLRAISVLWPGIFGDVMSPEPAGFWGRAFFDAGAPYVFSLAIGTVALLLLPAAFRDRLGRRFLLLAGVAAIASCGRFLPGGERFLALPGVSSLRYPEKWLFFAAFAALAAAAVGLDRFRSGDAGARKSVIWSAAVVATLSLAAAASVGAAPGFSLRSLLAARIVSPDLAASSRSILAAISSDFLQVAGYSFLAGAAALFVRPAGRAAVAVAVLLLFELFTRGFESLPFAPASFYDTPPAAALSARKIGGRLYYDRETEIALDPLRPMRPVVWGLSFAGNNDIDRFSPRRSFFFSLDLSRLSFGDPRKAALLRLAGVTSVSTSDPAAVAPGMEPLSETSVGRVLRGLAGGRRLRVVFGARVAPDETSARDALADPAFDPESEAIVEGAAPPLTAEGFGGASAAEAGPDREVVDATASSPALLVRSETFDPNWTARVDGRETRVVPADFAFQAVALPVGRHRIVFEYRNPLVLWGMFASLATLLGCAISLRGMRGGRSAE